jgi:hypothetical protein
MGDSGPGCFEPAKGLTKSQLFGWEVVMTFTLISAVYACGEHTRKNARTCAHDHAGRVQRLRE